MAETHKQRSLFTPSPESQQHTGSSPPPINAVCICVNVVKLMNWLSGRFDYVCEL